MPLWDCPICSGKADAHQSGTETTLSCQRCGRYRRDEAIGWFRVSTPDHQVRLSGWVREQNEFDEIPLIIPDVSRRIGAMRLPKLRDRANRALRVIVQNNSQMNDIIFTESITKSEELLGTTYSINDSETEILLHILLDDGYLRWVTSSTGHRAPAVTLTAKGMLAAEELRASAPNSAQGFVAMSFSDELRDAWVNGFDPAIRAAGYRPMRIDAKDYAGGVMDEIISEIRRSRFLVADCTQQRNGVYFEAGFAIGLGLQVIPTCRSDDMKNRHFDIQHLNTLEWNTPTDLGAALSKRIITVVGIGPDLLPK
jgi:nucleoside 2-deoxyribosyltransferase